MAPPAPALDVVGAPERTWLEAVHQNAQVPQLTLRAVVVGGGIGAVMCLSNLYLGLKLGFVAGVSITACLVSWSLLGLLARVAPRWCGAPPSALEGNAMQTLASSAAYATGASLVSASVLFLRQTGQHIPFWTLLAWTFCSSALGICFAVPLKRQLIHRERLPFPTGTAAATTLRALHERQTGGHAGARALGAAGLLAALLAVLRDGLGLLPGSLPLPGTLRGARLSELTVGIDLGAMGPGVGALLGLRMASSLVLGAALYYGVIIPALYASGDLSELSYTSLLLWGVWPGAALMVSASLTHTALQGKGLLRGFTMLLRAARQGAAPADPEAAVEVSRRWLWSGTLSLSLAVVALSHLAFGVPLYVAVLAVGLSFLMCVVACRVTGETDVTPGGLVHVTQLALGGRMTSGVVGNAMVSSVTGNTTAMAADVMTELKTGYLLGAHPRQQLLAQLVGCGLGSLVSVPAFYMLVPDHAAVGGERFPAVTAQILESVARMAVNGTEGLAPTARWAMLVGALLGVALSLAEAFLPARWASKVPSPTGMGMALLLPASWALSIFAGAAGAALLQRARPAADARLVSAASGLIAGDSAVSAGVAILHAVKGMG